jgi:3-methyladenine DNA glycosylase/8-oxoguanine DNA glycosylase
LRAMDLTNARELEKHAEAWRPWRAYAAIHLWSMPHENKRPHTQTGLTPQIRDRAIFAAS